MLISIIIPVYNAELYIKQCLDSVLAQTYNLYEVIIINDGSTDESQKIINNYLSNPKIICIQKTNSGVSNSRNFGIEKASGKFICFLDADDWLDPDYLSLFINNVDADGTFLIQNVKRGDKAIYNYSDRLYNTQEQLSQLIAENNLLYSATPFAKLYVTKIIKGNNITFNPLLSYGEDLVFFLDYIKYVNKFKFLNIAKYNYRYISGSLSTIKHPFESYFMLHKRLKELLSVLSFHEEKDRLYIYTIDWDMLETAIDQNKNNKNFYKNLGLINKELTLQHFVYGSYFRKILFIILKLRLYFLFSLKKFLNKK